MIHVDGSGNAFLLSHAMFMPEKTPDKSVAPTQVLVVDEAKIPFFEGIEERGGKRIGKRIETIGFDMPRKIDTTTQAALLQAVVDFDPNDAISTIGQVTAVDIENYVNAQTRRPPALVEDYHFSWPLNGGFGPGFVVNTPAATPLAVDRFHRSNPYRHAFHPNHGAGFSVKRALSIAFDDRQDAGQLTGDYEETITGLIATDIKFRGRIRLESVSQVAALR